MGKKPLTEQQELLILSHLRSQGRMPLTDLSRKTGVPVSTLFDMLNNREQYKLITKHTLLFDFQKLHYAARATIMISVEKDERDAVAAYLTKHPNINNLCRITNSYDFIIECIFKNVEELEHFSEHLENKFHLKAKETHYIITDLKREGFLSNPKVVEENE